MFCSHLSHPPWHLGGGLGFLTSTSSETPPPCSGSPLPRLSHQQRHPWPPADSQGQTQPSFLRHCRGAEGLQRGRAEAPRLRTASAFRPLLHLSRSLSSRAFTTRPSTILPFIHPTHMPIRSILYSITRPSRAGTDTCHGPASEGHGSRDIKQGPWRHHPTREKTVCLPAPPPQSMREERDLDRGRGQAPLTPSKAPAKP